MEKNYVVVYFRVIAMLMIVIFHCYCYNFGVWPFLISSPPPYDYSFSPLIFSTLGLSIFVIISGYLYGFGFFHLLKYKNNSEFLPSNLFVYSCFVRNNTTPPLKKIKQAKACSKIQYYK